LAWNEQEQAVIVSWPSTTVGHGRVVLLGYQLGDIAQVHWRVTHSGQTHGIYDRATACGLERASFAAVNAGLPEERPAELLPALRLQVVPQSFLVGPGEVARLQVLVCDSAGQPVPDAQVQARVRVRQDGRNGASSDYVWLRAGTGGNFAVSCVSEGAVVGADTTQGMDVLPYRSSTDVAKVSRVLSVQLKAWASGFIPADGACAFVLSE